MESQKCAKMGRVLEKVNMWVNIFIEINKIKWSNNIKIISLGFQIDAELKYLTTPDSTKSRREYVEWNIISSMHYLREVKKKILTLL